MRILIFSNWFPPIETGSSFYASNLALSLHEEGHEVMMITCDWGGRFSPSTDYPFPIHTIPVFRTPGVSLFYKLELMGFSAFPRNMERVDELVRRFKPDVIHHVNHIFDSIRLTLKAAKRHDIPLVGSITTPIQHEKPAVDGLMRIADRCLIGWRTVRHWDRIVSLDKSIHNYVGDVYGMDAKSRSVIIPFGARVEAKRQYDADDVPKAAKPQILMVGHIHPFRNPVQLIRAMPRVLRDVPDARLVLVGRMDIHEPLLAARDIGLDERNISIRGPVTHDEVVRLYKESHVFAYWLSGPHKSIGTASIEAMLCRTPVIIDLPEDAFGADVLRSGTNIEIIDSGSVESISSAIVRYLKDPELRRRVGEQGRQCVLEHLSWDRVVGKIERLYEELIAERAARRSER